MNTVHNAVRRTALLQSQKRLASYIPEAEMRRPEASSYMYRAVQDWKPLAHEVAHKRGSDIEEDTAQTCIMHMILVDSSGFRWPIRFVKRPLMTILDLFRQTDDEWFGVQPNTGMKNFTDDYQSVCYLRRPNSDCVVGYPNMVRCSNCAVAVPYEYLDAMAPPGNGEMQWLRHKAAVGIVHPTSNTRMACQVYIEDWMDGMTIVLPQTDSMLYTLYYSQGTDKQSIDSVTEEMHGKRGDGYVSLTEEDQAKRPSPRKMRQLGDDSIEDETLVSNYNIPSPFGESGVGRSFWKNDIDDIIRERYPNWKGRYEFLNK